MVTALQQINTVFQPQPALAEEKGVGEEEEEEAEGAYQREREGKSKDLFPIKELQGKAGQP